MLYYSVMTELTSLVELRKTIIFFQEVLTSLSNAKTKPYPLDAKNELQRNLATMMWERLPKHVVKLDLGDQLSVARPDKDIRYLPLNKRETWDLPHVDQYAAKLSQSIQQEWKPIFPPSQTNS
jgi:hypothetical protein